jgi:hypothetical protein
VTGAETKTEADDSETPDAKGVGRELFSVDHVKYVFVDLFI